MNKYNNSHLEKKDSKNKKILLALLPFWTSLIPPLGIASLKSDLQRHGFKVKTVDATIESEFKDLYREYFDIIKRNVPENQWGNFYSIGHDVLRDHLMAHLRYRDRKSLVPLVSQLISKTYYWQPAEGEILKLIEIIDIFYTRLRAYVLDLLAKEEPEVLGLSVFSDTLAASLFTFKITREKYPHIKTIMGGGVFADLLNSNSPDFKKFLTETRDYIDNIIIGEGEILTRKLLCGELSEGQRVYTAADIHNEILDLNTSDMPDFSDFPLDYYPYLASYTSRSCPYQCGFCSETIQWGKFRKMSPARVVDQLIRLSRQHGKKVFLLGDSLLNPIITGLAREFIKTGEILYWDGYLRVDEQACDMDNTLEWRQGGFYRARLGIESGSPHILQLMKKNITIEQIKSTIFNLASAGIKTTTYWVIGYPGETDNDFRQTMDLVEELTPLIYEAECRPFYFFLSGQVNSGEWQKIKKIPLFPGQEDLLLLQTWVMDCQPSREETYRRVSRFMEHCRGLGIPNPYTLQEIHAADKRWAKLHKNAVPSLIDFTGENHDAHENKTVNVLNAAKKRPVDDDPWL